jgi:hypothetical protein
VLRELEADIKLATDTCSVLAETWPVCRTARRSDGGVYFPPVAPFVGLHTNRMTSRWEWSPCRATDFGAPREAGIVALPLPYPAGKLRLEVVGATAVAVVVAYEHEGDARKQLSQSLRRERVHAQGRTPECRHEDLCM